MKTLFLVTLLAASFAQAHPHNPGCKKIHEACKEAKQMGRANMKCMHSIMHGEKVDGVTTDLTDAAKECSAAKEMHEMHQHEDAPEGATPEAK